MSKLFGTMLLVGLTLLMPLALQAGDPPPHTPALSTGEPAEMFLASDQCMACHTGLTGPAGEDISIATDWRSTMMANAARDPYWLGTVRRETLDHPKAVAAIEAECSICHMPMARYTAHAGGGQGQIFANLPAGRSEEPLAPLAVDGVSCTLCHQILADKLGTRESMVGRFVIDEKTPMGQRSIHGPFEVDAGRSRIMRSASLFEPKQAAHIRESGLCGSCHTLYTHSLGPDGQVVGELAEQVPYVEWQHSRYPKTESCQDCHMQKVAGKVDISSVWGKPREGVMQHVFRGGNFFIPRMLNAHRTELGVTALPQQMQSTVDRTIANLTQNAARITVSGRLDKGQLEAQVKIHNLAGHKLPSAYPSRRVWVHLVAQDTTGKVLFESGRLNTNGSIVGNDNDADALKYEPHYQQITHADQVQIYEPILGSPAGAVTTGLLSATQYLKDSRLLPEGFDKTTASKDIAVAGAASKDADFVGGSDVVTYRVPVQGAKGPVKIKAALYYQTVGYRWAHNLGDKDAYEPQRFVRYYQQAAHRSAVVLTKAEALASPTPTEPPQPQALSEE